MGALIEVENNKKIVKSRRSSPIFILILLAFVLVILYLSNEIQSKLNIKHIFECYSQRPLNRIGIKDKWFIDEANRVVLFHGINAVRKEFPWIPNNTPVDLTNDTQLDNLKKWGFNSVRLGVMWSGVMPNKNFINHTYLDEIANIIDKLSSRGIYTLIDLHQDMMSSKFASYDGVPLWILDEMPKSKFDFPWPLQNDTLNISLFAAYITESCGFAFQCLYDNVNSFSDYFQEYWSIISERFSKNKAILGYELLNEPWAGDVYANPLLLLPGFAGHFNLMKLYDRTHQTIREYDNDALIFYEPVTWGVLVNANYFGTGFIRPPGDDRQKTVFSWHYYCWLLQFAKNPLVNGTYPIFKKILCDNVQLEASFKSVQLDLFTLGGGPSFLTEFGVCSFSRDDGTLNIEECDAILTKTDKYLQSWAYWDSRFYSDDNQEVLTDIVNVFSRVYPMATNGIPEFLHFNTTTKHFVYIYQLNITSVDQAYLPTEIFIPEHVYPNGFKVAIGLHYKWSFDKQENILFINLVDDIVNQFNLDEAYGFFHKCKVSIFPLSND